MSFHTHLFQVTFKKDRAVVFELLKLERVFPPHKKFFSEVIIVLMFDAFVKLSWTYFVSFKAIRDSAIDFNYRRILYCICFFP